MDGGLAAGTEWRPTGSWRFRRRDASDQSLGVVPIHPTWELQQARVWQRGLGGGAAGQTPGPHALLEFFGQKTRACWNSPPTIPKIDIIAAKNTPNSALIIVSSVQRNRWSQQPGASGAVG